MGRRLFKFFLLLIVIGLLGLVGFAYVGDLTPDRSDIRIPVELNVER